jgi:hypothetical protein
MRVRRLLLSCLLGLTLAACTLGTSPGNPAVSSSDPTRPGTSSGPPDATARPSPTSRPTPEFPAPVELQGTWAAVSEAGDDLELEIREAGYTMSLLRDLGPERSSGRVVVDDDEIVFSNSNLCVGDGRYRWSIDGGVLRFEPIAPDACPGRADGLEDINYTRGE